MSAPSNPWAWLGLLKWSLTYSDGTRPSDLSPMSKEDREFLEKVMKEGIIDENERMKTILQQVTAQMEQWKEDLAEISAETEEEVSVLLIELRDIVEHIDYARAFAALKGIPFLLGCVQERSVPLSTRSQCCGIIATMAQHNPPVQKEMLEAGALRMLSDTFFESLEEHGFQAKLIQAISAIVRQNSLAEAVFCRLDQSNLLFQSALRKDVSGALPTRAIFFLTALLTSDDSDKERTSQFNSVLALMFTNFVEGFVSMETRELSLTLLGELIERNLMEIDDHRQQALAALSVQRIQAIRAMEATEAESHVIELDQWERLLRVLAHRTSAAS